MSPKNVVNGKLCGIHPIGGKHGSGTYQVAYSYLMGKKANR